MRRMTFECYVKRYLVDLSGQKTLSIHKLALQANNDERIKNVLVLYCSLKNKERILVKYLNLDKSERAALLSNTDNIENKYKRYDFEKIYKSYHRYVDKYRYENEIKSSIRENTIKMMKEKKITNYRIYKQLNLNPGNINDYLSNGSVDKVSLSTSKKIYQFCLAYAK